MTARILFRSRSVSRGDLMRISVVMLTAWFGLVAAVATPGCGKSEPPIGEVEGVLTLNGKPFPDGNVIFMPDPAVDPSITAVGVTDAEGKFRIRRTDEQKDGTYVGKYKVVIEDNKALEEHSPNIRQPRIYSTVGTTTFTVEVKPGKQSVPLEMSGRGEVAVVPPRRD